MNYAEIRQCLLDYVETDEPTFQQNVDGFIRTAERRIYTEIPTTVDSRATQTGTLVSTQIETTDDYQSTLQFIVTINNAPVNLLPKSRSFITEAYAGATGKPRYYAIYQGADPHAPSVSPTTAVLLVIGPSPDAAYDYEHQYIRTPPSIVEQNNTWLGDHFHTVLLHESLVEAARFLKMDPDVIAKTFKAQAMEDMERLKRSNIDQKGDEFRG